MTEQYDIIGDIHGHADELEQLLEAMGYSFLDGCYRHPSRAVVFLGDFIDRGPQQREVLQIVMPMVKLGGARAVMGNHEFNALSYHTESPDKPGTWLRPRNNKNTQQHLAFLQDYLSPKREAELADVLEFFRSLPVWLDLGGFRVVHACWDCQHVKALKEKLGPDNTLTGELLIEANKKSGPIYEAIEVLLKGFECRLPEGHYFLDKDGHPRYEVRTQWWRNSASTLGDITMPAGSLKRDIAKLPVGATDLLGYPGSEKPLFLGHYWLKGHPAKLADNVACLDYSVAKNGKLVAYRWSGERVLNDDHFFYL